MAAFRKAPLTAFLLLLFTSSTRALDLQHDASKVAMPTEASRALLSRRSASGLVCPSGHTPNAEQTACLPAQCDYWPHGTTGYCACFGGCTAWDWVCGRAVTDQFMLRSDESNTGAEYRSWVSHHTCSAGSYGCSPCTATASWTCDPARYVCEPAPTPAPTPEFTDGYTLQAGTYCSGHPGGINEGVTPAECKDLCDQDAACISFDIISSQGVAAGFSNKCVVVSSQCTVAYHSNWDRYVKQATTTTTTTTTATTTTTTAPDTGANVAPNVGATGDPHLQNVRGERFDVLQEGNHVLINIPRGMSAENSLLRVTAGTVRLGGHCADMYFQNINITGSWAEAKHVGGYQYSVSQGISATPQWAAFGKVEMKVVHGHMESGIAYLNFYAKHLGRTGFDVGGLLGLDDHNDVMTPPAACSKQMSLKVLKTTGTSLQASPNSVSSVAMATFE